MRTSVLALFVLGCRFGAEPTSEAPRCDGALQPGEASIDAPFDHDADGLFDGTVAACAEAYGVNVDCDDEDARVGPASALYLDNDGDGVGGSGRVMSCDDPRAAIEGTDCDDARAEVRPGGPEQCNNQDDDCDGVIDDGAPACALCGNTQVEGAEACDDGNSTSEDGCSASCAAETCGDGVVQRGLGEVCDDGNAADGDWCARACTALTWCGDGVVQPAVETCDDGNGVSDDGCAATCALELCGDGVIQPAEACDDGNLASDDGCSAACAEESCGDGVVQPGLGEACDDGDVASDDGCSATCAAEFCGDGVVQPGIGEACEPVAGVAGCTNACAGECVEGPARPLEPVTPDASCVGPFAPIDSAAVAWRWRDDPLAPLSDLVNGSAMVGNLDDDNGDGVVDERDLAEIVFTTFGEGFYRVWAVHGDGSGTLWTRGREDGYALGDAPTSAIADLEGDGSAEVITFGFPPYDHAVLGGVTVLDGATGAPRWHAPYANGMVDGGLTVADLDADGRAEIVVGEMVLDATGTVIDPGVPRIVFGPAALVVDWDLDGRRERVFPEGIVDTLGGMVQPLPPREANVAVADLDADGLPDLVRTDLWDRNFEVLRHDGTLWWSDTFDGGTPVIADVDGDGLPEVLAVNIPGEMRVYEHDGALKWSAYDPSRADSLATPVTFDLDGDGASEIVQHLLNELVVWDGRTGAVRARVAVEQAVAVWAHPIIADIDGDGGSEILVTSQEPGPGHGGFAVIKPTTGQWAPSRPVWDQYFYAASAVDDDLSPPSAPPLPGDEGAYALHQQVVLRADVALGEPDLCVATCAQGAFTLYVPVRNEGGAAARDIDVRVRAPGGRVVGAARVAQLDPGEATWAGPFEVSAATGGAGPVEVSLWVDQPQCDAADDVLTLAWPCATP